MGVSGYWWSRDRGSWRWRCEWERVLWLRYVCGGDGACADIVAHAGCWWMAI
jgi:hypothetical protein